MFGIANNRIVSVARGEYMQIQKFEGWPSNNIETVYLKDYGRVKVFRQLYKNAYRYYIMSTAILDNLENVTSVDFTRVHDAHWCIERFHRAIKQVCNIERFQVRNENPIKNHIFCAIKAFVRLELMRINEKITHWYAIKKDLYIKVIRDYVIESTQRSATVNA